MKKVFKPFMMMATVAGVLAVSSCTKTCDPGYEGNDCKTEVREKFVGQWTASDDCVVDENSGGEVPYVVINLVGDNIADFKITNVAGAGISLVATTTSSTSFAINSQDISFAGSTVTVTGNGTISEDAKTITLSYTVSGDAANLTCGATLTK